MMALRRPGLPPSDEGYIRLLLRGCSMRYARFLWHFASVLLATGRILLIVRLIDCRGMKRFWDWADKLETSAEHFWRRRR